MYSNVLISVQKELGIISNNSGEVESSEEHWPNGKYAGLWTSQFRVQVHVEVCVFPLCLS